MRDQEVQVIVHETYGDVRFGSEQFSQENFLNQEVFSGTFNANYFLGNHQITVGTVERAYHPEVPSAGGWYTQAVQWTAPGAVQVLPSTTGAAAANAAQAVTVAGYRADGVGGRHPTLWRCGG